MAKAEIWNVQTKEYDPYTLPEGASLHETDMSKTVFCAHCGQANSYGNMYTSRRIHSPTGFGYAVCAPCYYEKDFESEARK